MSKSKTNQNKKTKANRKKNIIKLQLKNKLIQQKPRSIVFFLALLIFTASVCLTKIDTPLIAEVTDDYLRPIFGNKAVIFLEKIYFNSVDKLTQISGREGESPAIIEDDKMAPPKGGDIALNPVPVNSKFKPLENEGVWFERKLNIFPDKQVLAYTFVRPDPERPYANVTLIQADMGPLMLGITAGQKQPGGPVGNPGSGIMPKEIIDSGRLVAAFDGGFQYRDGMYGMIIGDKTYLPLKNDIGTLVGYKNGSFKIVKYTGQDLGNDVVFIRQNCPILIENGELSVTNPVNRDLWGRTITSDIYTWRSGVGITREGNLIFAIGNNLNPDSLATALKMGGAINAIQLDINPFWVRFTVFNHIDQGKYDSSVLMKGVYNGAKEFLEGYEKDFFFLYKRP